MVQEAQRCAGIRVSAFQGNMKRCYNSHDKVSTQIDVNIMIMEEEWGAIKPVESKVKNDMLSIISKVLKMK